MSTKILSNSIQHHGRTPSDHESGGGHDKAARTGAFAQGASAATEAGLVVLPCGGEDGKAPMVKWARLRAPLGARKLSNWLATPRIAGSNLGIATGPSGLTVIDCDTPGTLNRLIDRFGETPIIISTPRGGYHLYYRSSGERCGRIDEDGLQIDVKGIGGFVVAPPSLRPSGEHAGRLYFFIVGSWENIGALSAVNVGALDEAVYRGRTSSCEPPNSKPGVDLAGTDIGCRNNSLFNALLRIARDVGSYEELWHRACAINAGFDPPLNAAEVEKIVVSVWNYRATGRLFNRDQCGIVVPSAAYNQLRAALNGADALMLLHCLLQNHSARSRRGDDFVIVAAIMAGKNVIRGWGVTRYRKATTTLLDEGLILMTHRGGAHRGDPHRFCFAGALSRLNEARRVILKDSM